MAEHHFAVLVDGENISPRFLGPILAEINRSGEIILTRVYGDWTQPHMSGWKELLQSYPVRPIQQFRYGENASDGALIMDAIEIVSTNRNPVNAFCIVSSDSDFYSLFINIVDNALEACSAMKSNDDRTIELACSMKNGFMHVMCRNSKENAVLVDEGRYVSTKTGNIKHGLGLGIIERIVEKYSGVMDIEHDRDWFVIKLALLPSQP